MDDIFVAISYDQLNDQMFQREMDAWLVEHVGHRAFNTQEFSTTRYSWYVTTDSIKEICLFYFKNNEDAILFKLTWA